MRSETHQNARAKWRNRQSGRGVTRADSAHGAQKTAETNETVAEEEEEKFKLWKEGPNFDTDMLQDVKAFEGKTAYLTCRVFDRQNKTVSNGEKIAEFSSPMKTKPL